jgi:sialate O-acetylesterase
MKIITFTLFFCLAAFNLFADVRLPDVLGASMVLQQKQKVPIWGTADTGETVVVIFQKQKLTVVADEKGKWRVDLKPLKASFTPETLTIQGKNKIEFKNILIGEVWLVAGQSNMQWTLLQSNYGAAGVAKANHPNIRLFNVSRMVSFKKRTGKMAEWKVCNPENVKDFSGAGYYFGVDLQKNLNVPIGLINSGWGGSQAEA